MTEQERLLDVAGIAFVTRRFHELQGLGLAVMAHGLVLAVVFTRAFDGPHGSTLQFLWLGIMATLSNAWTLSFWYRRTFGEIVVTPTAEFLASLPMIGLMLGVFGDLFIWPMSGRRGPSFAAVWLGLYALSVLARDGRRRLYYVPALAAAVAGAIVTANAPPGSPTQLTSMAPARADVILLAYTWVALSYAIAALLDHRLLATTLRPQPAAEPEPDRLVLRASNGRFRALVAALVFTGSAGSLAFSPASSQIVLFLMPPFAFLFGVILHSVYRFRLPPAVPGMSPQEFRRARFEYQVALIGVSSPAIWLAVAAAGAADSWMLPHGRFLLLPLTLAAWSAWVAVRDWPDRRHYIIGAMVIAGSTAAGAALSAPRSLPLLFAAVSGSLVIEGLLDHRLFRRHRVPDSPVEASLARRS